MAEQGKIHLPKTVYSLLQYLSSAAYAVFILVLILRLPTDRNETQQRDPPFQFRRLCVSGGSRPRAFRRLIQNHANLIVAGWRGSSGIFSLPCKRNC